MDSAPGSLSSSAKGDCRTAQNGIFGPNRSLASRTAAELGGRISQPDGARTRRPAPSGRDPSVVARLAGGASGKRHALVGGDHVPGLADTLAGLTRGLNHFQAPGVLLN